MKRADYNILLEKTLMMTDGNKKKLPTMLAQVTCDISEQRATYFIANWRMGLVYGTSTTNPSFPVTQLRRLSDFLGILGIPENHALIEELKRDYPDFSYPRKS